MAGVYQFQSEHFKGNDLIQACADKPMMHIQFGAQGDHVALIQSALKQIRERAFKGDPFDVPPAIAADPDINKKKFDISTRNCIQTYKNDRSIINYSYQTSADPIVGQMTIKRLDEEMAWIEGRKKDDAKPSQDFFIEIRGDQFLTGKDISDEIAPFAKITSNQKGYREKHGDLKAICFLGGIGPTDPFNKVMNRFNSESAGVKKFGRVVIQGTSVGGRTAMRVANQLILKGIDVAFLALNDAAFDENDPMLNWPQLSAIGNKISYFQHWSFTIDPDKEFHGCPTGFTPDDMTDQIKDIINQYENDGTKDWERTRRSYVASAHTTCCIKADSLKILPRIRSIFLP